MRITNKIMQNNSLYNINNNKVLQDKLNTQMTTQKKVTRPSDDPVVAIRSLRLRSNLNEVSQYYQKNIPDAESWLELTESALKTTTDIITDMIEKCQKGSMSSLTTSDRKVILDSLKQLGDEIYVTGDADYAGRTVFTGYRTDMPLSFRANEDKTFTIHEQLTGSALTNMTYVDTADLVSLNETNYNTTIAATEQSVDNYNVHKINLAYNTIANGTVTLQKATGFDLNGKTTYAQVGDNVQVVHAGATPDPYRVVGDPDYTSYDADAVVLVAETGELLLGENVYKELQGLGPNDEFCVTYDKTKWEKGDLRPEHYFACESDGVSYNSEYMTENGRVIRQDITYDVGFNQSLQVNTTADQVFYHGIGRTVEEIANMTTDLEYMDNVVNKLEKMVDDIKYNQDDVAVKLKAATKAQTLLKDKVQKAFESGISTMQGYLDSTNLAITEVGNRSARLELVENRLRNQQTTFQTLTSANEDIDLEEIAIQLSSAETTYNAALSATGKVISKTLLDYL